MDQFKYDEPPNCSPIISYLNENAVGIYVMRSYRRPIAFGIDVLAILFRYGGASFDVAESFFEELPDKFEQVSSIQWNTVRSISDS